MKSYKILILAAALFFLQVEFIQAQSTDSAKVISVEKFEKMAKKQKNTVIDIRTPEEVQEGQLEGALNIDFLDNSFATEIDKLDKNKPYLLYCRTGKRTAKAGAQMKAAGFKKIYMLDGGITKWQEQGKPIEQ